MTASTAPRTHISWETGVHHGLISPAALALIGADADLNDYDELWAKLRVGACIADIIRAAAQDCGVEVLSLPGFAVAVDSTADSRDVTHIAVRGEFAVRWTLEGEGSSREFQVTGAEVSTWVEQTIPRAQSVTLALTYAPDSDSCTGQGIREGIVSAGRLTRTLADPVAPPTESIEHVVPPREFPDAPMPLPKDDRQAPELGDHDGMTIMGGLQPTTIPGHGLGSRAAATMSLLVSPTGERVPLTTGIVAGRSPRTERSIGADLPILLELAYPHISGTHLDVWIEDGRVLARDTGSRNGTFVRRIADGDVRRLPGEPTPLSTGDVLDLGEGVHLTLHDA